MVGHVEWVQFAVVERLPMPGEILHARQVFTAAGGGGGVASVVLRELAGGCRFLTAVGADTVGDEAVRDLEARGVDVHAARPADSVTRRAFTYLDDAAERTITVLDPRIVPSREDDLPWDTLERLDAIYFTGGDAGALRAARAARVLVATPRARDTIEASGVQLDVLVASANDPGEAMDPASIDPPPREVVLTDGARGGTWSGGRWAAAELPGPPVDAYGCGDAFAAGLTYALGAGLGMQAALELAAACGARRLTLRGPYGA